MLNSHVAKKGEPFFFRIRPIFGSATILFARGWIGRIPTKAVFISVVSKPVVSLLADPKSGIESGVKAGEAARRAWPLLRFLFRYNGLLKGNDIGVLPKTIRHLPSVRHPLGLRLIPGTSKEQSAIDAQPPQSQLCAPLSLLWQIA